ncbi:TIR domain-containing protein [Peribacillus butanolivorans]|uniref:TIR domain-containing protein n=1 Tax=Peribacillus butanolivorans TaxID=421767 RepID=UPI003657DBFF
MYYHVSIKGNIEMNNKELFEFDYESEEEVLKGAVIPYLQKSDFHFDGYLLKHSQIGRFKVKMTDLPFNKSGATPSIYSMDLFTDDVTKRMLMLAKQQGQSPMNSALTITKRINDFKDIVDLTSDSIIDRTKVFIVHGHDELAQSKVARFVERLGFETIILHEQASSSKTIIEKIEKYSNVGFGIVLYTPCDIGAKNETEPKLRTRARQNVVFEHGFLMGKIGRSNVCALIKDEVETPNDISGVVYVTMDPHDAWKNTVAKEMKESGYKIDLNKL